MEMIFCEFVNFQNSFLGWFIETAGPTKTKTPVQPSRAPKGFPSEKPGSWGRDGGSTIEMTSQMGPKRMSCLVWWTILLVNRRLFWVFCFLPNSSLKWSLVECEIAFSSCGWLSQNVKSLLLMAQKKGLRGCVPLHVSVMCREGWQQPLRIEEIRQAAENHEPWAVKARLCLHWTFAEQTTVLQLQFTELVHAMHMHKSFSIAFSDSGGY